MAQPYIGQIVIFGFTFAPRDYAFCNGQLLAISQNTALFSILGTTYGGDGITTFALPNIQEKGIMNLGQGPGLSSYNLGEISGVPTVALTSAQIPLHNHAVNATAGTPQDLGPTASGWFGSISHGGRLFSDSSNLDQPFAHGILANTGGSQAHDNAQPFLVLNYSIALFGIFPSRN